MSSTCTYRVVVGNLNNHDPVTNTELLRIAGLVRRRNERMKSRAFIPWNPVVTLRANSASRNHSEGRGTNIRPHRGEEGTIFAVHVEVPPWCSTHGRDEEVGSGGDGYSGQHSFRILIARWGAPNSLSCVRTRAKLVITGDRCNLSVVITVISKSQSSTRPWARTSVGDSCSQWG